MSMAERIANVEQRIRAACTRSSREREEVNVIAVTKYVDTRTTGEVIQHGFKHIGENRWQDAQEKWQTYSTQVLWHFIGHLQTNKVKDVAGKFAYFHSLDRLSLAVELNKRALALGIQVNCFIQLNVSGENTKFGLAPEQLFTFCQEIQPLKGIHITGLMCMAPHESVSELTRPVFRTLRLLRDQLNQAELFNYVIPHLSMGMSNDFEIAIEEGATWIRLGSVLVGTMT